MSLIVKEGQQYYLQPIQWGIEGPIPSPPPPEPNVLTKTREQAYEHWGVLNVVVGVATIPIINANVFKINRCLVMADIANAGVIYVAESAPGVGKGARLPAAAGQVFFINDLAKIQLSASMAGQLALVTWYR